jgi:hypothetical protein
VSAGHPGPGTPREEAERLVAAGLGAAAMALQGMEARRQLRALADQFLGSERVQDLAAGLSGFVSGVSPEPGPAPSAGARSPADPWAAATSPEGPSPEAPSAAGPSPGAGGGPSAAAPSAAAPSAGFATGSADCCVCPVCRVIAALRDPSPELAERLATAAGDLAVGVSGLLRALGGVLSRPDGGTPHDPWRVREATPGRGPPPPRETPPLRKPLPAPEMPPGRAALQAR